MTTGRINQVAFLCRPRRLPKKNTEQKDAPRTLRRARGSYIRKQESFDTLRSQRSKTNATTTKSPYPRVPSASTCHLNRKRPKGDNSSIGEPRCPHNIHRRRTKRWGIEKPRRGTAIHPIQLQNSVPSTGTQHVVATDHENAVANPQMK